MALTKKQKQARVNEINKLARRANKRARQLERYGADPKHTALKYYNEAVSKYHSGYSRLSEHHKYHKNMHYETRKIRKFLNAPSSTVAGLQRIDRKRMRSWNKKIQEYGEKNGMSQRDISKRKFKNVEDFRKFVKSDYWDVMKRTYSSGQAIAGYTTSYALDGNGEQKSWEQVIEETTPFFETENKEDIAKSLGFETSGDLVKAEVGKLDLKEIKKKKKDNYKKKK